jgi:hypothetical protein
MRAKAAPLVLVVVAARVAVVELTVEHAHGTGQVRALLAQAGQGETRAAGGTWSSSRAVTVWVLPSGSSNSTQ